MLEEFESSKLIDCNKEFLPVERKYARKKFDSDPEISKEYKPISLDFFKYRDEKFKLPLFSVFSAFKNESFYFKSKFNLYKFPFCEPRISYPLFSLRGNWDNEGVNEVINTFGNKTMPFYLNFKHSYFNDVFETMYKNYPIMNTYVQYGVSKGFVEYTISQDFNGLIPSQKINLINGLSGKFDIILLVKESYEWNVCNKITSGKSFTTITSSMIVNEFNLDKVIIIGVSGRFGYYIDNFEIER